MQVNEMSTRRIWWATIAESLSSSTSIGVHILINSLLKKTGKFWICALGHISTSAKWIKLQKWNTEKMFICTAVTIIHSQFRRISNPTKLIVWEILIPNMKCREVVYRPSLRDWLSNSYVILLLISNLVQYEMKC